MRPSPRCKSGRLHTFKCSAFEKALLQTRQASFLTPAGVVSPIMQPQCGWASYLWIAIDDVYQLSNSAVYNRGTREKERKDKRGNSGGGKHCGACGNHRR